MCFGMATTDTKTMTPTPNPAVAKATVQALNSAEKLNATPFQPYTGEAVAPFSGDQNLSFDLGRNLATGPTLPGAVDYVNQAGGVGPQSVNSSPISDWMGPYMNRYVQEALAPQLELQNQQFAAQNRNLNSAATSSGAFGDARAGVEAANLTQQQNIGRTGLIGQAYNAAFNTAIGAGAQDVSNNINAQTQNANLRNQYATKQLATAQGLEGAGNYGSSLVGLTNTLGAQQTAQKQAGLNWNIAQYQAGQQYPFLTQQAINQTIAAGATGLPAATTTTEQKPDNSGWALGGAVLGGLAGNSGLGTVLGTAMLSDEEAKTDIRKVGELDNGLPVYRYRYRGDPENVVRIGLIAQDVEAIEPAAVLRDPESGFLMVDYGKATALERALAVA